MKLESIPLPSCQVEFKQLAWNCMVKYGRSSVTRSSFSIFKDSLYKHYVQVHVEERTCRTMSIALNVLKSLGISLQKGLRGSKPANSTEHSASHYSYSG